MELKINLEKVLFDHGFMPTPLTNEKKLKDFFNLVKPTPIDVELIRLGGQGDGGYLVPNDLENIEACFSPGVSTIAHFEEEISKYGIKSYMIDFSVDNAPHYNPLFDFEKKWLGISDGANFIRLEDWVNEKCPNSTGDLMLQMDIEGAEYENILDTPEVTFRRFRTMIIEFHKMELLTCRPVFDFYYQVFSKLLRNFSVIHIHPNNCCGVYKYKNFEIPRVIEFTFQRKGSFELANKTPSFPHSLDRKNVERHPELILPKCWW